MRITSLVGFAVAAPILAFSASAQASTFVYNDNHIPGNVGAGAFENIQASFDDQSQQLTWSSTFSTVNGNLANGAWLVLNDGPNPKSNVQENTMFYLDGVEGKLTAYTYNGVNGSNSWTDDNSVYLDSWALDVEDNGDERTFSFDINMAGINGRTDLGDDWEGTAFGEKLGIWYHAVNDLDARYEGNELSQFSYSSQGWYDTKNQVAERVPEPSAMAGLAVVGLLAAKSLRRRQQGS